MVKIIKYIILKDLKNMNKSDIKLILIIIFISLSLLLLPKYLISKKSMKALVYYEDKLIQTIDLSLSETREYVVDGYNGKVVIENGAE